VTIDLSDPADDFYGGLIEARRAIESELSLSPENGRVGGAPKGLGVTVAYGNTVRSDRPGADMPDDWPPVEVMDPWGSGSRPTRGGRNTWPMVLPLQGAATTAGCRLVVAILKRFSRRRLDRNRRADRLRHRPLLDDGRLDRPLGRGRGACAAAAELAAILERFNPLVHPSRPAWKLDKGTAERDLDAIVYGPNKVVIIDPSTGEVTWASEFAGPGVFADPVFGEDLLPDGRRRWWRDGVQLVVDGEILVADGSTGCR